jgi:tripartite-type tricarboxylate transporter receptor subunit TctC
VVPFPPGSGSDVTARVVAKIMSEELAGHPVIVDNKPGAGTFIGAQDIARSAPDGHSLLYTIVITHTQNPHLYAKLPYDPVKDFTPLAQMVKSATVLVAHPSAPFNNVAELVTYAKANPGKLNYASFSQGSTSHLNGELLQMRMGISMLHVPYKGTADASRALLAGDVQLYFDGTASAVAMIKGGKAKGIGSATPTRVSALPTLPTLTEQGVKGLDIVGWQGIFGPGSMDPVVAKKIADLLSKVARAPEMLKLIEAQGNEPSGAAGAEFAAIVKSDFERWGEVIRTAQIKLD